MYYEERRDNVPMNENILRDWLHRRHITDAVIDSFDIHLDNGRIVIPIRDAQGRVIFNKYRRSPLSELGPKYTYDKGSKASLFGIDKFTGHDKKVLVTEGEIDSLVAWSANIPAVSSTGGALSFFPEWREFFDDKEVVLCFDNDPAGGEGMVKAFHMLPHSKILFLPDRPGVKDISDYVSNGGDLSTLMRTARNFSSIQEVIDDRSERQSTWKSTYFHDAFIKKYEDDHRAVPVSKGRDMSMHTDLAKAKSYPMAELLAFSRDGKAKCPWHSERTASLHYFKEENRVHCFGCGKGGDAVDLYMQMNGCDFKKAVKELNK